MVLTTIKMDTLMIYMAEFLEGKETAAMLRKTVMRQQGFIMALKAKYEGKEIKIESELKSDERQEYVMWKKPKPK